MRNCIFFVLLLAMPVIVFAQKPGRYMAVEEQFVKYYNAQMSDSLLTLFTPQHREYGTWSEQSLEKMHKEQGKILSFKYMYMSHDLPDTKGRPMALFKVTFSKTFDGSNVHAMGVSLTKDNRIFGVRFTTSNPKLDAELAKY